MKIYFLLPELHEIAKPAYPLFPTGYPHGLVVLAEGLTDLGVRYFANTNYWQNDPGGEFLFKRSDTVQPEDADVVVCSHEWFHAACLAVPPILKLRKRPFTILIDGSDFPTMPGERLDGSHWSYFDLILRAHVSRRFDYPPNVIAWPFGLSLRLIREADRARVDVPFRESRTLLWNFRHGAFPQTVRTHAERALSSLLVKRFELRHGLDVPSVSAGKYEQLMAGQTGGRHCAAYYTRLARAEAVACFGGWFSLPYVGTDTEHTFARRVAEKLAPIFAGRKWVAVRQWDSWRFWETMAVGRCAIHLDFDKYGMKLPVKPENGVHYVGVDLEDREQSLQRLLPDVDSARKIGEAARSWVLEHYSPKQIATRFLELLASSRTPLRK